MGNGRGTSKFSARDFLTASAGCHSYGAAVINAPDDFQPHMDDIFREKVRRARLIPPGEKMFSGLELFEEMEEGMRAGVRHQFPAADAGEVERILRERFARIRQIEEHGLYRPVP